MKKMLLISILLLSNWSRTMNTGDGDDDWIDLGNGSVSVGVGGQLTKEEWDTGEDDDDSGKLGSTQVLSSSALLSSTIAGPNQQSQAVHHITTQVGLLLPKIPAVSVVNPSTSAIPSSTSSTSGLTLTHGKDRGPEGLTLQDFFSGILRYMAGLEGDGKEDQ